MEELVRKNIYFISDMHLSYKETEEESEKRGKLLGFFEAISDDAGVLYILGDLFDFWFEWYHVIPKYWFPVLYQLRKMVDKGIKINLITGNHDFYTGRYLEKEIGVNCSDECMDFEAAGKRFFVAHGDGYAKRDRGYRLLKRIIRSRISIFLYKTLIPADLGMQIARWTSRSSRKWVKIEKQSWSEEYYQFAQEKFREGFDCVLLGHIHAPLRRENGGKVYINCGDWMTHFTYARYDGQSLTLHHWAK